MPSLSLPKNEIGYLKFKPHLESFLQKTLSGRPGSPRLYEAMSYTLLNGGKRIRAAFIYLIGNQLGLSRDVLEVLAASVEMVHAFSLIHDDLPGMDNDDMRRGKPSCHIVFGEALAILAGDALHTEAFSLLARSPQLASLSAEIRLKLIDCLALAVGAEGMVAGQAMDMFPDSQENLEALLACHRLKTGNLLQASILLPVIAAGLASDTPSYHTYQQLGERIGLVFQIQDDILDVTRTSEELGKTAGKDLNQNKMTFPSLLGLPASQAWVERLGAEIFTLLGQLSSPSAELHHFLEEFITRKS